MLHELRPCLIGKSQEPWCARRGPGGRRRDGAPPSPPASHL